MSKHTKSNLVRLNHILNNWSRKCDLLIPTVLLDLIIEFTKRKLDFIFICLKIKNYIC